MATFTEQVKYKYDVEVNGESKLTLLSTQSQKLEKQLDSLDAKVKKGLNFSGVGTALTGAAVGFGLVGKGMWETAQMAGDLAESMNVVNSVFGDGADEVVAWSETAITSMGLSQTQALKTAGTFGALATGMGIPAKDAQKMGMELTQLSADLASFWNVSQDEAATALKGIFTGESDALQQFGANIQVAALEQYGYNENMSESEKIMIRYQAVLDATATAQGDFNKTSDSLSNQTRIMKETFKQLATEIGSKLAPMVSELVKLINEGLGVAIAYVTGETGNLSAQQQIWYDQLVVTVEKVKNLWDIFIQLLPILILVGKTVALTAISMKILNVVMTVSATVAKIYNAATKILSVGFVKMTAKIWAQVVAWAAKAAAMWLAYWPLLLIIAVIAALIYAYMKFETFQRIVNDLFKALANIAKVIMPPLIKIAKIIGVILVKAFQIFAVVVAAVFTVIIKLLYYLSDVFAVVWKVIVIVVKVALAIVVVIIVTSIIAIIAIWKILEFTIKLIWQIIVVIVQVAMAIIVGIIQAIIFVIVGIWNILVFTIQLIWTIIVTIIQVTMAIIVGIITVAINIIVGIWNFLVAIITTVWNIIVAIISSAINVITGIFNFLISIVQKVIDIFQTGLKFAIDIAINAFNLLMKPIEMVIGWVQKLLDIFNELIGKITGGLSSALSNLPFIGGKTAVSANMINATTSALKSMTNAIPSLANASNNYFNQVSNKSNSNTFNFTVNNSKTFRQIQEQAIFARNQKGVLE